MPPRHKQPNHRSETDAWKKRRHKRKARTVLFWYKSIELGDNAPKQGISYCFNLSTGGLGAIVGERLSTGSLLFVELTFVREGHEMSAVGRVVYTKEISGGRHEMGFEFLALSPDGLHFLTHQLD